jgi:drug/metabolite transporter (DMT)-like permease
MCLSQTVPCDDAWAELRSGVCAGHKLELAVQGAWCSARPTNPGASSAAQRQRWFAVGWILALFAWALHVEAVALAPLSSVQAVLSGGLVFLAVLAERFFGFHLGRRQWAGVTLTATGLAVIGLTATSEAPQRSSLAALIVAETAVLAIGVGLVRISTRRDVEHRSEALLLAVAAGVLFGVSDVAIKYLTHAHGPVFGLLSPWTLTALISFVVSFYASARSLQIGLAIEVIAITSVAANLSAIVGGILVFGEPIGSGAVGIIGRARIRTCHRGRGARARPATRHLR